MCDGNEGVLHISEVPALLEPHHQIVYCHIQDTCCDGGGGGGGGSYPFAEM